VAGHGQYLRRPACRFWPARRCKIPTMIKAVHTLIYSDDPVETQVFLRDVIGWPSVADPESTPPWPIFKSGPSEMAVHPTSGGRGVATSAITASGWLRCSKSRARTRSWSTSRHPEAYDP
jgi:hypothetical protein